MTDTQKSTLRKFLMLSVPAVVLAVVAVFWLLSGRYESTDNAYVKADKIMISPDVSGTVIARLADNNQSVKTGDALFTIDPRPFEIALQKAEANLGTTRAALENMKTQYQQKQEEIVMSASDMDLADVEFERTKNLEKTSAVSKSALDTATRNRDNAHAKMALLQREAEGLVAQLAGEPDIKPEDHPTYKSALAAVEQARLDLGHTHITAPADGIVTNVPNVGDYARISIPAMSLVSTSHIWVEANFKETQIENIKPGQDAEIDVDTFSKKTWHGRVESINPATGSEFSILPAQNATGNWVKVVQRIAVHIAIDDNDAREHLRSGMSAEIKVDLHSGT